MVRHKVWARWWQSTVCWPKSKLGNTPKSVFSNICVTLWSSWWIVERRSKTLFLAGFTLLGRSLSVLSESWWLRWVRLRIPERTFLPFFLFSQGTPSVEEPWIEPRNNSSILPRGVLQECAHRSEKSRFRGVAQVALGGDLWCLPLPLLLRWRQATTTTIAAACSLQLSLSGPSRPSKLPTLILDPQNAR